MSAFLAQAVPPPTFVYALAFPMTDQFTATLHPDRKHFIMQDGAWNVTAPIAHLPRWIAMYQRLHDRKNEAYAHFYVHPLTTLKDFQRSASEALK
jgi:hypothetical protein